MCLTFFLHNFCPKSSLVYVLVWSPPPHTAYVITQSVFSFHNACSYHYSTFFCSTKVISSIPSLSFNSLQQQQQQPFYGPLSGTTRVSRYKKKHSPTHHPDHYPIFISFFHLLRSIASSLFKLRAWQSCCTTSLLLNLKGKGKPRILRTVLPGYGRPM